MSSNIQPVILLYVRVYVVKYTQRNYHSSYQ
jgi:hypothetical protein